MFRCSIFISAFMHFYILQSSIDTNSTYSLPELTKQHPQPKAIERIRSLEPRNVSRSATIAPTNWMVVMVVIFPEDFSPQVLKKLGPFFRDFSQQKCPESDSSLRRLF